MKAIYVLNSMFTDICFLIALLVNIFIGGVILHAGRKSLWPRGLFTCFTCCACSTHVLALSEELSTSSSISFTLIHYLTHFYIFSRLARVLLRPWLAFRGRQLNMSGNADEAMSSPPETPSKRVKNEYSQNFNTVRERNRIANMDEATRKQHNERKREREAVDRVRRRVRGADWFKALPEDKQEAKMEEEIDKFSAKR